MKSASKKLKTKSEKTLTWYLLMGITSSILSTTVLILSWVFFRQDVWTLSSGAPLIPTSSSVFELPTEILGNRRIILPDGSLSLFLGFMSILAPLTALLIALISRKLFNQSRMMSFVAGLAALVISYRLALPGADPSPLFTWIIVGIFLFPLSRATSGLQLWALASAGVVLGLSFPQYQSLVLWSALSIALARCLHFIVIDRLSLKRSERRNLSLKALQFIAGLSLFAFVVFTFQRSESFSQGLGQSTLWYLSFSGGILAFLLSFAQPWQSLTWMTLATFCQGALFFQSFDIPVIATNIYLLGRLVYELIRRLQQRFTTLSSQILKTTLAAILLLISFGSFAWLAKTSETKRSFNPQWIDVLESLDRQSTRGSFVIGNGLMFLSQFRATPFTYDPDLLLEPSEERWTKYLNQNNLDKIIVELSVLQGFWSDFIRAGNNPEQINKSVLGKILSDLKRLEKKDSKLDQNNRNFKVERLPEIEDLVIVRLTARP